MFSKPLVFIFFVGFDVPQRKIKTGRVGSSHKISKEESMKWFQQTVRVEYFV